MKANRKFMDEEAVSPVIGVILMVAITVILAAVIAAFVFGMGSSLKKTYTVAATASQQGSDYIDVVYNGGPDHQYVTWFNVTGTNSEGGEMLNQTGNQFTQNPSVGLIITMNNASLGRDHIIATASFSDGTSQVVLDAMV